MPTRAVAYIRVSLDKMAEDGVSLDAQRARVTAHAQAKGLELVDVVVDAGLSAKSLEREGLQRALGMLRAGEADALLVVKLDRLTRSLRDFEALLEEYFTSGTQLLSCTEQVDTTTAGGRMVLRILMAVAQHEREATAERTSATARHQASRGQYTGGAARYGWRVSADGAQLEQVPEEQAIITKARELRASGLSLKAVGEALAAAGHVTRKGTSSWDATQVKRMLAGDAAPTP